MTTKRQFASVLIRNIKGQILLVRETKPQVYGLFNLPGGHVEEGETPLKCAIREVAEETGLHVQPKHLLGEYQFHAGTNVVYLADGVDAVPASSTELRWDWHWLDEVTQMPDAAIMNPAKFRAIVSDLQLGKLRHL